TSRVRSPSPAFRCKGLQLPPRLRKKCGKLGQRSPQGNIKTRCYATPHKPENAANCRRRYLRHAVCFAYPFHTYRCIFVPRARKKIRPDLVISRCGKRDSTRSATVRLS